MKQSHIINQGIAEWKKTRYSTIKYRRNMGI